MDRRTVLLTAASVGLLDATPALAAPKAARKAVLDAAGARRFVQGGLSHVTREYPSSVGMVRNSAADLRPQKEVRPVFYGSYDWTSSIATHWLLATLHRAHPTMPEAAAIAARFDEAFTPEKVAAEIAFFKRPMNEGSGRLGGWAWLMTLSVELARDQTPAGKRWLHTLAPLTEELAARTVAFLPKFRVPGRTAATPMGLLMMVDYAKSRGDPALLNAIRANALEWYEGDVVDARPPLGGEDTAPAELAVAELMRRVLPADHFGRWFRGYMPGLASGEPALLLRPVDAGDRGDMRLALAVDTLNLTRAWLLRSLAQGVNDGRADVLREAAERHFAAGLPHLDANYLSQKSLPSWALLGLRTA